MCSVQDLPTNIVEKINEAAKKHGFSMWVIESQIISTDGNNYIGRVYQVDVKGRTEHGDEELNLFVKINSGFDCDKWISISGMHQAEMFVYKELGALFEQLQNDANVPLHDKFKIAKYYDGTDIALILDNIAKKGFKIQDRMKAFTLDVAELVTKALAKLHALSFVLEEKRPEYFQETVTKIKYPFIFGDPWFGAVRKMIKVTTQYLDEDIRDKVEAQYVKLAEKYKGYFEDDDTKRCLCHGDYKTGNIMLRTENGKVVDVIPVDYQFAHYGCPVLDFVHLIFLTTDKQLRDTHLSHLKDVYHDTLKSILGYFNMDVELVYPRQMFEEVYRDKVDYGLLMGYLFMPFLLAPKDDVPEFGESLSETGMALSDVYKVRQRDLIQEFAEMGYIK